MAPPERIVTTIQVTIEHNAEDQQNAVLSTALRRWTSPSWEVTGEVISSQPKGPEVPSGKYGEMEGVACS